MAVEIDLSAPDVEKASVHARLGVSEIWRWRDGRLTVLARQPDGTYADRPTSVALPGFPLRELADALAGFRPPTLPKPSRRSADNSGPDRRREATIAAPFEAANPGFAGETSLVQGA